MLHVKRKASVKDFAMLHGLFPTFYVKALPVQIASSSQTITVKDDDQVIALAGFYDVPACAAFPQGADEFWMVMSSERVTSQQGAALVRMLRALLKEDRYRRRDLRALTKTGHEAGERLAAMLGFEVLGMVFGGHVTEWRLAAIR